ncbi:hypothetical protein AWENTII_011245 [Aspergillus wentii]
MQPHSEPILALDPAMLADPAADSDDSDYEYEYHDTETESVYLNLDLTSLNGPIRPPRRRPESSAPISSASSFDTATTTATSILPSPTEHDDSDRAIPAAERVQILGLHTPNPIVSYQNQIFSCSWADQIGTELFFTHPENSHHAPLTDDTNPDGPTSASSFAIPALKRGKDFDLVAANRVKILGRKANLISSSGPVPDQDGINPQATDSSTTNPRRAGPPTNQSRFLERLMNAKRAKGGDRSRPDCVQFETEPESRARGAATRMGSYGRASRRDPAP